MRVGINTGEVLVGSMSGSDYTAMGDVVNTAARLQALAPPGGVLVGSATVALCTSAVICEPFGATDIRGREQEELPWIVTGAAPAGSRPVRADVPFVGRVSERTLMASAVDLVRNGRGGVVSIVGEAGSGKTRLISEIIDPLGIDATLIRVTCAPYGQSNVWAPIATGLSNLLQLDPDAGANDVHRTVEKRAVELWGVAPDSQDAERFLTAISHLFGHPSDLDRLDAAGAHDAVASAITDMMRRHASTRFTVLWVDNLQWADPMLRDQLAVVARSLSDLPFLLVTAQRPDDDVVWPPSLERPLVVRVPLGSLGRDDAGALVCSILESEDPPAELSEGALADLVDRGGGNPLYLVELAALAASCSTTSELPGSLRALIAARLDQLTPSQRAIVDNAAVLGSGDAIVALERFARSMMQDFSHDDLAALVRRRRARGRRQAVAIPQRRRPRRRLPDAHQAHAGPTPRRYRRRDPRREATPHRRPRPPRRRGGRAAHRARAGRGSPHFDRRPRRRGVAPGRHPRRRHHPLRAGHPPHQPCPRSAARRCFHRA